MSDGDWKKLTSQLYPIFHSAIAFDDMVSKKDFAGAIKEYTADLMLYSPAACAKPGPCLVDTLQLAQVYSKPGATKDAVKAVWFFARAWDFAPPAYQAQIEPQLDYWYKRYHGTLDGDAAIKQQIDAIKAKAQATLFPPADFTIAPAPTPARSGPSRLYQRRSKILGLEDKEFILANGTDADATGLWALLKGQPTPVPGIVIADPATVLKITVTTTASVKPKDFVVKLTTSAACSAVPPAALRAQNQGRAGLHPGQRRQGRYRRHGRRADRNACAYAQDRSSSQPLRSSTWPSRRTPRTIMSRTSSST